MQNKYIMGIPTTTGTFGDIGGSDSKHIHTYSVGTSLWGSANMGSTAMLNSHNPRYNYVFPIAHGHDITNGDTSQQTSSPVYPYMSIKFYKRKEEVVNNVGWGEEKRTICGPGMFSFSGVCVPCAPGSYKPDYGDENELCLPCEAGKYASEQGRKQKCTALCHDGYYCEEGSSTPKQYPCNLGHYCIGGAQIECDGGTFQDRASQMQCENCRKRFYCPKGSTNESACRETFFCPGQSEIEIPCHCNSHGSCYERINICDCFDGWVGSDCSTIDQSGVVWVYLSLGGGLTTLFACLIIIIGTITVAMYFLTKRLKFYKKFDKEIELIQIEENELQSGDKPLFKLNKNLFKIDSKDVKLIKKLGSGGFAEVFLAEWSGKLVAMKLFQTSSLNSETNFEDFEKELEVISSISHPNVMQFFGACLQKPRIGLILEYCKLGDLSTYIMINKGKFPLKKKISILRGIISAMIYLHNKKVIHRDLKPENVLLNEMGEAKLCDFGLSRILETDNNKTMTKRTGIYILPYHLSRGTMQLFFENFVKKKITYSIFFVYFFGIV